jgi:hypothetical protein
MVYGPCENVESFGFNISVRHGQNMQTMQGRNPDLLVLVANRTSFQQRNRPVLRQIAQNPSGLGTDILVLGFKLLRDKIEN